MSVKRSASRSQYEPGRESLLINLTIACFVSRSFWRGRCKAGGESSILTLLVSGQLTILLGLRALHSLGLCAAMVALGL